MTRKEAADMIRDDIRLHHDYLSGKYRKALRMAIDALEKLPEEDIGLTKTAIEAEGEHE